MVGYATSGEAGAQQWGWGVQVGTGALGAEEAPDQRALVMVSPDGSIRDLGPSTVSRRSAHRGLTSLYAPAGAA
jgi:hypothetical protein